MACEVRTIRDASELEQAYALRIEVFCDEQGVPRELEVDPHDAAALHLVAYGADGQLDGTCRIVQEGELARFGRLVVRRERRRSGIGAALLEHAVAEARAAGARRMILSAQRQAEGLYATAGFVAYGEAYEEAGIEHIAMARPL
jgi:predicted GNAT family N-acyltransferase